MSAELRRSFFSRTKTRININSGSVFLVLVAALALGWSSLERRESTWRNERMANVAELLAARMESYLRERLAAMTYLREGLRDVMSTSLDQFESQAMAIQTMLPGWQALNWVDSNRIIQKVVPLAGNQGALHADLTHHPLVGDVIQRASQTDHMETGPPIDLLQGSRGVTAYLRVKRQGKTFGYLNAVFRIDTMIEKIVPRPFISRYAFSISDSDTVVYQSGVLIEDLIVSTEVAFGNRVWSFKLTPLAPLPGTSRWLVAVGLVLSAGLALLMRLALLRQFDLHAQNEALRKNQNQLSYMANYDDLTGLPNRVLLRDRLSRTLATAKRYDQGFAVMYVDLDRFKAINDTMGHACGDAVLKEAADRLQNVMRESDTLARMAGDEFLIILPMLSNGAKLETVATRILRVFAEPFRLEAQKLYVTASVGVATYPADGGDVDALLHSADAAMYRAKKAGRNTFMFFTKELSERARKRVKVETLLRGAVERSEFVLHYQPIIDVVSGRVSGAEALLRWNSPELGMVGPSDFIPVAEESDLIVEIGAWVIETASRQIKVWKDRFGEDFWVSVNVSTRQFRHGSIVDNVRNALEKNAIEAKHLALEITEGLLMDQAPETNQALIDLSDMGLTIAIDDFGTGYSSIQYLKFYDFNVLKIDSSFVRDLATSDANVALVRTIIAMARNLDMKIVAEGVETVSQLQFLADEGCEYIQGFLFSKAVPSGDFERVFADFNIEARRRLSAG